MHANAFLPIRRQLALLFVLVAALCDTGAFAQAAPGDPPGRVAQLNYFDGPVSFAPAGFDQWAGAVLNRPLTQGDQIWNDAGARSELHIDSTVLRLDGQTSLAFSTLDDQTVQLALSQGSVTARLRSLLPGQRFEVDTPNLAFTATQPGDYRLDVDPIAGTTRVTLQSGSAVVFGSNGGSVSIGARQQITFSGADLAQVAGQSAPALDPFDRWAEARDHVEDQSIAARYVPRDVIGYQQLDPYGDWDTDPVYGAVWVPRVTTADWAPYRVGHWASIAPWGWTWVDDEPWGFAPFHYGRWALRGARWCWVPGAIAARPVYAPALVGFVGGSAGGVNFSVAVGSAVQAGVAWFPLAPGEAWRPSYRASPRYLDNVNRTVIHNHITNTTNVTHVTNVYRYQHLPAAVTAVPMAAFAQGQHVRGNARPVPMAELQRAGVVAPPAPTRDPRSVFGASRLTQAHPAPPAAVVDRRVVSNPAFQRGRADHPTQRAALPGQPQYLDPARGVAAPPNASPLPASASARQESRPPQVGLPPAPREHSESPRNAVVTVPRPPSIAPPDMPHPTATRPEQVQPEQAQRAQNAQRAQAAQQQEQVPRAQNAQREQAHNEQAARAAQQAQSAQQQQQQDQQRQQMQRAQNVQREQAQNEQATRAAQVQEQRAQQQQQQQQRESMQQEQQMQRAQNAQREQAQNEQAARAAQVQAQRAQQQQQQQDQQRQQMQRAQNAQREQAQNDQAARAAQVQAQRAQQQRDSMQQEQQQLQQQARQAQAQRVQQEQRSAQEPIHRARPGVEPQRQQREEQRPEPTN